VQGAGLSQRIGALLEQQVQCVLATLGGDQPELHLMAFSFAPQLDRIFLASLANTRKVRNMMNHPGVGLLWDNRTRQIQDHIHGVALNASGQARRLFDAESAEGAATLLQRNPTLAALLDHPDVAIFAIEISQYRWVQGYGKVEQYVPV
jgi:nitroimidazol reductase NimA-like FMN-containing flavoprotein (pyridoxamine 5'-phosphate oxidase superfamily)